MTDKAALPPWAEPVLVEWRKRRAAERAGVDADAKELSFPLISNGIGEEEVVAVIETVLTDRLTLGPRIAELEKSFAEWVGAPFACMVTSGSTANLLAMAALSNPERAQYASRLKPGDEILVPCVSWSTSVYPIMQIGCTPVFVDTDPITMNIYLDDCRRRLTSKTRGIVMVHVLGNSAPMQELMDFCRENNLLVMEDTCESLGSRAMVKETKESEAKARCLGTLGDFGTYSFYYSHHMTTGEGGMVVCHNYNDLNLLRCLRAHGWTRHRLDGDALDASTPDVDKRFNFVNTGYNFRPLEVSAAIGIVQLKTLEEANGHRRTNLTRIVEAITADARYSGQFSFMEAAKGTDPAWFGVACLLDAAYGHQQRALLEYLNGHKVENRPIISGNFARQPVLKLHDISVDPLDYPGAEIIHNRGFFIGSHNVAISDRQLQYLVDTMLSFEFEPMETVLVTGGFGLVGSAVQRVVAAQKGVNVDGSGGDAGSGDDDAVAVATRAVAKLCKNARFVFVRSQDGDLTDPEATAKLFAAHRPTYVLHLAGKVSSIHAMAKSQRAFYLRNSNINRNVLETAARYSVKKVVSCLSTAMLPVDVEYPVTEASLHSGPPHPASTAYANAKRELDMLSRWLSAEFSTKFVCAVPGNVFGQGGDFSQANGPVAHALIRKCAEAKVAGAPTFDCLGTGNPLRQFIFSEDLAHVLLWMVTSYEDSEEPTFVAGPEISIRELAETVAAVVGFEGKTAWSGGADGALRRTASIDKLCRLYGGVPTWTPLKEALQRTYAWYMRAGDAAAAEGKGE